MSPIVRSSPDVTIRNVNNESKPSCRMLNTCRVGRISWIVVERPHRSSVLLYRKQQLERLRIVQSEPLCEFIDVKHIGRKTLRADADRKSRIILVHIEQD